MCLLKIIDSNGKEETISFTFSASPIVSSTKPGIYFLGKILLRWKSENATINILSTSGRIKELIRVINQKHTEAEVVDYFSTNRIIFEFDWEAPAQLDRERYFELRFEVSILPRHLQTIYNPYGDHYFEIK